MRIITPIVATCAAAAVVGTIGLAAPQSASAEAADPDVKKIPLTDVSDTGLKAAGATAASVGTATVANRSATADVPGAFAAANTAAKPAGLGSSSKDSGGGSLGGPSADSAEPAEKSGLGGSSADSPGGQSPKPAAPSAPAAEQPSTPAAQPTQDPGISGGAEDRTEDGAKIASLSDVLAVPSANPSVVGITYSGQAQAVFEIRVKEGGAWSGWSQLESENTGEGSPGTEPYIVSGAESVQVRVLGDSTPEQTQVVVVDPKRVAADAAAVQANTPVEFTQSSADAGLEETDSQDAAAGDAAADDSGAFQAANASAIAPGSATAAAGKVAQPKIASRKDWGAKESLRKGSPQYASKVKATIIHHTAGSNSYSAADVPGILRGIYSFHTKGRGWADVGYNVLVDKYGRAWQGRAGDIKRAVIGAHAANYNTGTFGISVMGSYDSKAPSDAALRTVEQVIAWKFSLDGVKAKGKATVNGRSINTISGHRDVGSTTCPGDAFYAKFGSIRSNVEKILKNGTPKDADTTPKDESKDKPTGTVIQQAYKGKEKALGKTIGKELKWKNGWYQEYQKGIIAYSKNTGARAMYGDIAKSWMQNRDVIGLPRGDQGTIKKGYYQAFEKGAIHYSKDSGAHATWGDIWTYWKSKAFERGHLGYPTSDPKTVGDQIHQSFQGATVVFTPGVGVREYSAYGSLVGGVNDKNQVGENGEDSPTGNTQDKQPKEDKPKAETPKQDKPKKDESKKKEPKKKEKSAADKEAELRAAILDTARSELGTPYVWGGTSPKSGWDCSGYTQWVYGQNGISLPRTTSQQRYAGKEISAKDAKPGDLVWIPGHIGIISESKGMMYDAGSKRTGTSKRSYEWMLSRGAKFIRVVGA